MTKDCKHPAWEKFYPNDDLTNEPWRCVTCGVSKPKRPSDIIRERAEEHARKIEQEIGVSVTNYEALLGCQVEAIKAYLDQLAGFPKSE